MDSLRCCKELAEEFDEGHIGDYPAYGGWSVSCEDGGGGRLVLTGMKFCPFCGTKLPESEKWK